MSLMKHLPAWAGWGLGIAAILFSPVVLILGIPMALGIGLDLFDMFGETPVALALCVPVAFVLLRRLSPRVAHHFAASPVRPRLPLTGRPS
jgi:hypothetical protein